MMVEMQMPLSICLPVNDALMPIQAPSKAKEEIGDPGTTEVFQLPRYVYVFILKLEGTEYEVMDVLDITVNSWEWEKQRYVGELSTVGDSIYRYHTKLYQFIRKNGITGRVYAIASPKRLTFNVADLTSITTLDDLLDLTIDVSSDSIQDNLQNIYTTPYNYIHPDRGVYYGTFQNLTSNVASLDLLLYHLAAKVDLKWNVVDSMRIKSDPRDAVRLTYMDACNLYTGPSYCFRPMENEVASVLTEGKTRQIVRPDDEGLWWEGRSYFYTIPYTVTSKPNYFPLQMVMKTNNSTGVGYKPTLNMRVDTSSPFVPWLRADFVLSQPLRDANETRTVDD